MSLLWIGIISIALAWLFLVPINEPAHSGWWVCLGLAVLANSIAFIGKKVEGMPRGYALFLLPAGVFGLVFPWPRNLGAILLFAAIVAGLLLRKHARVRPATMGLGMSGLVLIVQSLFFSSYSHAAARFHTISGLDAALSFVLKLAGVNASSGAHGLFVQTAKGISEFSVTWESLGLFVLFNVALGGAVLASFSDRVWDNLFRLLAVLAGFAAIRYLVLLVVFASFETADVFWLRSWQIVSFLPLPFVLMRFVPLHAPKQPVAFPAPVLSRRLAGATAMCVLAVVALIGALVFQDPGLQKQGRVLFDEGHSEWEWMDRTYDTQWYGEQSGYNYYSLGQFLDHYYHVEIRRDPLTADLLKNFDVLVLKTPTNPYSQEEIDSIVNFVKAGGGLWLVGDHTNVFGMGTYLNSVARHFGFAFKYDATYDLATGNLSFFNPSKILRHPVINDLPFYLFATSDSLDAPFFSEDVIVGYGLKAVRADYSQKSFFPKEAHSATAIEHGLFLQSAAAKFGSGRVLLYTDSTCFSNFYMFMPGKPELALGSIQWLNRRNKYGYLNLLLLALGAGLMAGAYHAAKFKDRKALFLAAAFALLLEIPSGIWVFDKINSRSYRPPKPHTSYQVVAFEAQHSNFYLPVTEFKPGSDADLQTFYVWTQRLGLVPQVRFSFLSALASGDTVVIVNPAQPFTNEEVAAFVKYVESGGKVLLMDDPRNKLTSTAHQLLRPLGVSITYQEIPRGVISDRDGNAIWEGEHLGAVMGGEPFLYVTPVAAQNPNTVPGQPVASSSPGQAANGKGPGPPDPVTRPLTPATVPLAPGARPPAPATLLLAPGTRPPTPATRPPAPIPVLSVMKRGKGTVAVLAGSSLFYTATMGTTSAVPDARLRKLYDLEYSLFRDTLNTFEFAKSQR